MFLLKSWSVPKSHGVGLDSPRGGHVFDGTPGDGRRPLCCAQQHLLGGEIDLTEKSCGKQCSR